ncbi:ADP-ribosylation factor-like protein [Corallococcus caeni]|uniref:ADP-ribosylation factor-like protein n=1 Tax=Corallococcus caeni TaxID=3082388 RepID=A0ABQ6QSW0_9BACT|nr:ADP-ribosylation factor-like protein [Corallococcus sp. KH5-1]GMU07076.1 ADP-ribosylation factor-like protein [Corallococcus sp. NO1]
MQLNHAQRELTLKIVYYGPGLSGKTTNLRKLHARARPDVRGRLLSVDTHDDRTLFFDLLPVFFSTSTGFKVKVKLFTVPGQVIHNATRRVVLQGADAVVFIADSRRGAAQENNSYWRNLQENLREMELDPTQVPVVIQFNKRDLPDSLTDAELAEVQRRGSQPVVGSVAVRGEGVVETFHAVVQTAWRALEGRAQLSRNVGLSEEEFLGQIFRHIDLSGTALEGRYGPGAIPGGRESGRAP